MPYINQNKRNFWAEPISAILDDIPYQATEGDLNYIITTLVHEWLKHNTGYAGYNAAIGVLECAKLELYAMKVRPYEDEKIAEHGGLA